MGSVNANTAAKAGDFLFRYMRARHRFVERAASLAGLVTRSPHQQAVAGGLDDAAS